MRAIHLLEFLFVLLMDPHDPYTPPDRPRGSTPFDPGYRGTFIGDEIQRRANRALASRLSKAHFEDGDKTFENFDWTFNPKLPQEQLRDLATGGYLMRKEHILLCGPSDIRSHYPSLSMCIGK